MTLLNYSLSQFLIDIAKLQTTIPNETELTNNPRADINTRFFGGREWEKMQEDINNVLQVNKKYFCVCLFTMTSADQNMFTHFRNEYPDFRKLTNYPKFGYTGFGLHFEEPRYLLDRPTEIWIDFNLISDIEIDEFIKEKYRIAPNWLRNIPTKQFFDAMMRDDDFNSDSDIFARIKSAMEVLLPAI